MLCNNVLQYIDRFLDNKASINMKHVCRWWRDAIDIRCVTILEDKVNCSHPTEVDASIQVARNVRVIKCTFATRFLHTFENLRTLLLENIDFKNIHKSFFSINTIENLSIHVDQCICTNLLAPFREMLSVKYFKFKCINIASNQVCNFIPINTEIFEIDMAGNSIGLLHPRPLLETIVLKSRAYLIVQKAGNKPAIDSVKNLTIKNCNQHIWRDIATMTNLKSLTIIDVVAWIIVDLRDLTELESFSLTSTQYKHVGNKITLIFPTSLKNLTLDAYCVTIPNVHDLSIENFLYKNTFHQMTSITDIRQMW